MRLDYGTQISYAPITLSIGTIHKPTLHEIAFLGFDKFDFYKFLTKMTPEFYYKAFCKDEGGEEQWNTLSEKEREEVTIYQVIEKDEKISAMYVEMFNFFFEETVIFTDGLFLLFKKKEDESISNDNIRGIITHETFSVVIDIIQQITCIHEDEFDDDEEPKFKNALAKKLYEKMKKAKAPRRGKSDENLTIPNIISALSSRHPSLNYSNIWNLTVYQLVDTFNRTLSNSLYEIDSTRVSVWGDEKNTFDATLWYKNEYDKK